MKEIAILMTCHNRLPKTLECLLYLFNQEGLSDFRFIIYLVDDGSTDDTGVVIKEKYPDINVLFGDGNLFWNKGMHLAFGEALKVGHDYYLWLNDDTYLHPTALKVMLDTHTNLESQGKGASIVVASTQDPKSGSFTYGGYVKRGNLLNPLRLRLLPPSEVPIPCDTMCGNCVLIPESVSREIGNIDGHFQHRWGDVDYGLRACRAGCEVWIAPGYLATCKSNPKADGWRDRTLSLTQRLHALHGIKGLGKHDWYRYTKLHGGILWMTVWIRPYMHLVFDTFR